MQEIDIAKLPAKKAITIQSLTLYYLQNPLKASGGKKPRVQSAGMPSDDGTSTEPQEHCSGEQYYAILLTKSNLFIIISYAILLTKSAQSIWRKKAEGAKYLLLYDRRDVHG